MRILFICLISYFILITSGSEPLKKDHHDVLTKTFDEVVQHLVRRHKRQAEGEDAGASPGGQTPATPSNEEKTWTENVGGYLDTVGEWLGTVNGWGGSITGIINTATDIISILNERDRAKAEERRHQMEMALKTEELCDTICVTEWTHWTPCTARCGGGIQQRQREHLLPGRCKNLDGFICRHRTEETNYCNLNCPNGGWPVAGGGGCNCKRGFNGPCCNNDIVCEYPGRPRYGDISGEFPAKYGSVVSYSCGDGFALLGESELVCHGDGEWTGQKPECHHVTCSMPPSPENGRLLNRQNVYVFGEDTVFLCNDGYRLRGPDKRKCTSPLGTDVGRWTGFTPYCEPVNCEQPEIPLYGEMHGVNFRLGSNVTFTCMQGFRLKGSQLRRCLPSGRWSGHQPECEVMKCEPPFVPKHGALVQNREEFRVNQFAAFECETGYHLVGDAVLRCIPDLESGPLGTGGKWDSDTPICQASMCESPGEPVNGAKDGSLYYYPHNITFTCFAGHVLHGLQAIQCQADGTWSGGLPTCSACPANTYKASADVEEGCIPCPTHTHTVTEGSTSIEQCICDKGFKLSSEETCEEISCPLLEAPERGVIVDCGSKLSEHCDFDCDEGYIMERGSSRRTCQESGEWSGRPPVCTACPKNTFKSDARSCLPCPRNSHTVEEASTLDQCICDEGYDGPDGGPCGDFDECGDNPCADACENTIGDYRCVCHTPGWIVDPMDKHLCKLDKTCRNLTEEEAPLNGGLVCHWYREENSQQCSVRCNPGFEYPTRVNNYEFCGPTTGYLWSHEEREEPIEPCIEEFFPDFTLEAKSAYFVRACRDLSETEKDKVKEDFANMLTEQGVCKKRSTKVCDMKNVGIICGKTTRKKKKVPTATLR